MTRAMDMGGLHRSRAISNTLVLACSLLVAAPIVQAETTPWAAARRPAKGSARAIGSYSAGCLRGAIRLPLNGKGYQLMRPRRRRVFGHPNLIGYIRELGKALKKEGLGPVLVGDLGQPMGGPAPRGHASHQSGLDVDIWLWHPRSAERRRLTPKERQRTSARRVVDAKKKTFTRDWSEEVAQTLAVASAAPEVSRIFVNPLIKQRMCESGQYESAVLRKLRPWYGHDDHMHVRLHCPKDSPDCLAQKEVPEGDDCEGVAWWLDDEAQEARRKGKKKYQDKVGAAPALPEPCQELIR